MIMIRSKMLTARIGFNPPFSQSLKKSAERREAQSVSVPLLLKQEQAMNRRTLPLEARVKRESITILQRRCSGDSSYSEAVRKP